MSKSDDGKGDFHAGGATAVVYAAPMSAFNERVGVLAEQRLRPSVFGTTAKPPTDFEVTIGGKVRALSIIATCAHTK